jgi:hypothetical protein
LVTTSDREGEGLGCVGEGDEGGPMATSRRRPPPAIPDHTSGTEDAHPHDANWREKFRLLAEYRAAHGDCRVPRKYAPNPSLGLWVGNQRMMLRSGTLRPDRRRWLESIGFEPVDARYAWKSARDNARLDSAWKLMYEALLEYKREHGTVDVPKSYVALLGGRGASGKRSSTSGKRKVALGRWVSRQRIGFARGNLREDRSRLLDDLGFVWSVLPATKEAIDECNDLEPLDFRLYDEKEEEEQAASPR